MWVFSVSFPRRIVSSEHPPPPPLDCLNYVDSILCYCLLVPARNPYVYDYRAIDYNTIWIRWERLSPKDARGILRGYRIHYSFYDYKYYEYGASVSNITVDSDILEMTITGLQPNTNYRVWVKAFTSKGEGSSKNIVYVKTSKSFLCSR